MNCLCLPAFIVLMLLTAGPASAAKPKAVDCLSCHDKLTTGSFAHPALSQGCAACHTSINASVVPHRNTGKFAKGLSANQPGLCYGCHDKSEFRKKNVHAALRLGCTACHDPHSGPYQKMLKSDQPGLCFTCHDSGMLAKRNLHHPVRIGRCVVCHAPHSSGEARLLLRPVNTTCVTCHDRQAQGSHVLAGHDIGGRHPLSGPSDPSKAGRGLSCISCHDPHSSQGMLLFSAANSATGLCQGCHARTSR